MTFLGSDRMRTQNAGDIVPGVPMPSSRDRGNSPWSGESGATSPAGHGSHAAYVFADGRGLCLDATEAALTLLGIDLKTLRMLRVGDLTRPDSPGSLTRQLVASCDAIGRWLHGACELLRPDGAPVRVRFGAMRLPTGTLVARFEPLGADGADVTGPRAVLDSWRRQELVLVQARRGTVDHQLAELEALWLAAEYQRLVIARSSPAE
jgi:hypothetical protein